MCFLALLTLYKKAVLAYDTLGLLASQYLKHLINMSYNMKITLPFLKIKFF